MLNWRLLVHECSQEDWQADVNTCYTLRELLLATVRS